MKENRNANPLSSQDLVFVSELIDDFFFTKSGDGLAGTIVKVCTDHKKNCQRFGKVYKVNPDKCTILKGDGLSGNMVRFYIADSNLAICEMRIYGI